MTIFLLILAAALFVLGVALILTGWVRRHKAMNDADFVPIIYGVLALICAVATAAYALLMEIYGRIG